eukprot:Em1325g1a
MALRQGLVAAGISYGYEYALGYNPTVFRSAVAGLCGAADYYSKSKIFPAAGLKLDGYASYAGGAVAGGATYAAILSYFGAGDLTSSFIRGAIYAVGSHVLLSYISPDFFKIKFGAAIESQAQELSSGLMYKSPSL